MKAASRPNGLEWEYLPDAIPARPRGYAVPRYHMDHGFTSVWRLVLHGEPDTFRGLSALEAPASP